MGMDEAAVWSRCSCGHITICFHYAAKTMTEEEPSMDFFAAWLIVHVWRMQRKTRKTSLTFSLDVSLNSWFTWAWYFKKHAVGLKAGERVAAAPGPYLNHLSAISSSQELPEGSKSATAHSPRCNVFCCLQTGSVIELFSPGINLLFLSSRRQTLKYKRKKIMDHERQWFLFFYFAARRHETFWSLQLHVEKMMVTRKFYYKVNEFTDTKGQQENDLWFNTST